jgi:hypothetical protein
VQEKLKATPYLKLLIQSSLLTLLLGFVFMLFNHWLSGDVWGQMTVSQSAVKVEYCEFNNTDALFHQKMNTYSNLAYFFIGAFILLLTLFDNRNKESALQNKLQSFSALSFFMAFCFVYLCFGSAFFHASLTLLGQRVDMNGTYSISIALLGISVYHLLPEKLLIKSFKRGYIGSLIFILLLFVPLAPRVSSGKLIPVLVLTLTALQLVYFFLHRKERYLFLIILSFGLLIWAIKIRTMDVQKTNCDPYSWYQGHSLWHVLTALSSFLSYSFFRFQKK